MARGLTNDSNYQSIADAIREKNGSDAQYLPKEMSQAIRDIVVGVELNPLGNPASDHHILSGYEAYDAEGNLLSGKAYLTGSVADFTLVAGNWNGTTYTLTTTEWIVAAGQQPLMDLPYTSSAVNVQRVVESGITMPSITTSEDDGTTTIIFSAVRTPLVDVDVAVFNITAATA